MLLLHRRAAAATLLFCAAALAAPSFKVTLSNTVLPRDTALKMKRFFNKGKAPSCAPASPRRLVAPPPIAPLRAATC